ncbi:hypothetical protein XaplCFBP3123_04555 [Xanthomonas arboricola pv. populi]|nr:hypothetical protein XaplCFBP3123_04555 [Xanthomonas arboricola pv. populi]
MHEISRAAAKSVRAMVELDKADQMPGFLFNPRTWMCGLLQGTCIYDCCRGTCINNWQGR